MAAIRPALRKTLSSPGSSTNEVPTTSGMTSPNDSTTHISILEPDRPDKGDRAGGGEGRRSRPTSGYLSPADIHATMHAGGQVPVSPVGSTTPAHPGIMHRHSIGGDGLSMRRTSTAGSGSEGKYRRKVGFEAFEAGPAALFAYTCQAKSEGYKRSRNTRVFAVAVSPDEKGEDALDWLMTELVEDGDEVVAIRVIELDEGARHNADAQDEFREDAHHLLASILEKNNEADDRRISVTVEFVAGPITDMLLKMIALYRPDSLVVGTKGSRSRLQNWGRALGAPGMGSVSRFAVSHSPVPVIVVRPERKVKKSVQKRQADPKRGQYAALVGANGLELSRSRSRGSIGGGDLSS